MFHISRCENIHNKKLCFVVADDELKKKRKGCKHNHMVI